MGSLQSKEADPIMLPIPYVAGLFDAEGCITVVRDSHRYLRALRHVLVWTLSNTDHQIMRDVFDTLSSLEVPCQLVRSECAARRGYKVLYLAQGYEFKSSERLAALLLPYSVTKADLLGVVRNWCDYRRNLRKGKQQDANEKWIAHQIKELSSNPARSITDLKIDPGFPEAVQWLAGFFDGDGTIGMYAEVDRAGKQIYSVSCRIGSVSKDTIDFIDSVLTVNKVGHNRQIAHRSKANAKQHDLHTIQVTRMTNVARFIELMIPYTIIKKERLQVVAEWIAYRKQRIEEIRDWRQLPHTNEDKRYYDKMRELNRR